MMRRELLRNFRFSCSAAHEVQFKTFPEVKGKKTLGAKTPGREGWEGVIA
jgi:hypothetical protein